MARTKTSYKPGKSGNPQGRPPGAVNKVTEDMRSKIEGMLIEHFTLESIAEDLKAAKPHERLRFKLALIEYVLPKMRSTEMRLDIFENLSDNDLDKIIDGLINKTTDENTD